MGEPAAATLSVLHHARGVWVVDKPAGLPSTGRDLHDPGCVQWSLQQQVGRRVWAVHQLDRDTTGVNVFVDRANLVKRWQAWLRDPGTHKTYVAVVQGLPSFDRQRCDGALLYDDAQRRVCIHADGKAARSDVNVVARGDGAALVRVRLWTGRTHQARVHLSGLGYPVVGDVRYGAAAGGHERVALHAATLTLCEEAVLSPLEAPWPPDLLALCDRLGLPTDAAAAATTD